MKDRYNAAKVNDPAQNNAEMAAKLARLPLQHQPGTRWDYSMSTDVLGRVVEVVGGMELAQFIEQRISEASRDGRHRFLGRRSCQARPRCAGAFRPGDRQAPAIAGIGQ